jgi:hypothetical protein
VHDCMSSVGDQTRSKCKFCHFELMVPRDCLLIVASKHIPDSNRTEGSISNLTDISYIIICISRARGRSIFTYTAYYDTNK